MSKPVSSLAIGAFLVGGVSLLVLALLVFGGGQFFKPKIYWVVYFESSLNGLNLGAPVKVQGVQVGVVKEIELQLDPDHHQLMKPVVLEIEPWRLASPDGMPYNISHLNGQERSLEFKKLIDAGLRARLEVQSILTGLLYVDLDFHRDQPARLTGFSYKGMPEVPSIPPTVDEVVATLVDVVRKIKQMPLESMVEDLTATLRDVRHLVGSDEARQSQVALAKSLVSAQSLLGRLEKQLPAMVDLVAQAAGSFDKTSLAFGGTVKDIHLQLGPILKETELALKRANRALEASEAAASNLAEATSSDSTLQESLVEISRAVQSVRQLTDYLERHPESLIFGKPQ